VRYAGAAVDALSDVHLDIPAGATVGVVGATGSGKSTLAHVLARQIDPPPETVFVDGADLGRVDLDAWRERLVLVAQRPFLFSESVRDNVAMGRAVDADALVDAAALRPDVVTWPEGLDTVVGERGLMLSGGQRQRVALARALGRTPLVLVLDDVLSAVDAPTARHLLSTLRSAAVRPTTLVVSHRLDAVRDADLIAVLDAGRLVDAAPHDVLLGRCAAYRDLFDRQAAADVAA
jgi:ATP-binding cassette subfamily B protein